MPSRVSPCVPPRTSEISLQHWPWAPYSLLSLKTRTLMLGGRWDCALCDLPVLTPRLNTFSFIFSLRLSEMLSLQPQEHEASFPRSPMCLDDVGFAFYFT